ncbi:hypothetical protein AWB80_07525 [Caballeronia pedi]|uniref:Uncharacterized protein n=1 Tax=Caballeronia pedi TaxID=1777141 RepID=A0A158DXK8_9BURK|nr:hypothetical protein [Caballeronia pedi]SAK98457.1 hypothetical protein AWB80_07525 [Caballeronia pedi]
MKTKGILRSMPRAEWTSLAGRPFALVGPHHVIVCDAGAAIQSDALDAAELARRWNAYPILIEALQRVAATRDARHALIALKGAA